MIQPDELKLSLPVELSGGVVSTTDKVWQMLKAAYDGNLLRVKELAAECPALLYAQYNYAPPIHFAVTEGHPELVRYLLANGAHDSAYRIYPFLDSLPTLAEDRGDMEIAALLNAYENDPSQHQFEGDNGAIHFKRDALQSEFENAVDRNDLQKTAEILQQHPEYALDETWFWGEGILMMPAKENHREMMELLMRYGAKVPAVVKWAQAYYFERYDGAEFLLQNGMNPNAMTCQRVTILHNIAQNGDIDKAGLLIRYGADLNSVDGIYHSTPLGFAARWGQVEMVAFLLAQGADIHQAGAPWATPLEWARKKQHSEIERLLTRG